MEDEIRHTSVHCPWCHQEIEVDVAFLAPGPDTDGQPVAEVDDGYLRRHLAERHGG